MSGLWWSISAIQADARSMNMPLFQSHLPDSTYPAATSDAGFSTNSDRPKPLPAPSIELPFLMYP